VEVEGFHEILFRIPTILVEFTGSYAGVFARVNTDDTLKWIKEILETSGGKLC
jgi:hypothetical protein